MKSRVFTMIAVALTVSVVLAQQAPPRPPAIAGQGKPQFVSPDIQPDRKITFRISAPTASGVRLRFANKDYPMTRRDKGVWSATVGPVQPEIYQYSFEIGGARVNIGQLEVPGKPPR